MALKQLKYIESIKNNDVSPVYLFIGEEDYFKEEAINNIVSRILTKETVQFNYDVLRAEDVSAEEVYKLAVSVPMLADKRVILIKNFEKLKNTEIIEKYVDNPSQSTVLIFDSGKNSLKSDFFKKLKNRSFYAEFKPLYDNQIKDWIKIYIESKGKKLDIADVSFLYECVGGDLRSIINEIEKICIYSGDEINISRDTILKVIGISRDYNVFELRDAVGDKNISRSIQIVNKMIDSGENEVGIVVMLTKYFTELGKVKELFIGKTKYNEISEKTGIHRFFLNKYIENSKKYDWPQIRKNFEYLLDTDRKLKTGFSDSKTVLTILVKNLIAG